MKLTESSTSVHHYVIPEILATHLSARLSDKKKLTSRKQNKEKDAARGRVVSRNVRSYSQFVYFAFCVNPSYKAIARIRLFNNIDESCLHALYSVQGDGPEAVTPFLTNVYLEASSSSTYIQDGFHLLLPVFQLAVVKAYSTAEESANVA